ncbi:MAG: hypothetical protein KDJ35_03340 [Alphaproteobacteria bacterium]|nr:hypothetical protein [Alphaproteobacteria bacterium]
MTIVRADNPALEKHLTNLVDLVEQGGGGTHSDLVLQSENGNLQIYTDKEMKPGREIIRLSRAVLLPADQYEIGVQGSDFTVNFPANSRLSELQKNIAQCLIEIYNETNKVELHKKYSFLLSLAQDQELLDRLMKGRVFPDKHKAWIKEIQGAADEATINDFVSTSFLQTRFLGYSDKNRMGNVSVLMPIVDFLNHHWVGSGFSVGKGTRIGDLTVHNSQPFEDSRECFAFYGPMDAFDSLIRYDFADTSAPVVRSIPIELDVPHGGKLRIAALVGAVNSKKLMESIADLHRYLPVMNYIREENTLKASHIFIPVGSSKHAMRRVLSVFLKNFMHYQGVDIDKEVGDDWIKASERKIIQANIDYYEDLKAFAQTRSSDSLAVQSAVSLAQSQLEKLKKYEFKAA